MAKKSKVRAIVDWLSDKDVVGNAVDGVKFSGHLLKDNIPSPGTDIDIRAEIVGKVIQDYWKNLGDLKSVRDYFSAFDFAGKEMAENHQRIVAIKPALFKINKELKERVLRPLSEDEVKGYFQQFPPREVKELPVKLPAESPFLSPTSEEQADTRRALAQIPALNPSPTEPSEISDDNEDGSYFQGADRLRSPAYPVDPVADIGEHGDFGGPGSFDGGGFNSRPSHGDYDIDPIGLARASSDFGVEGEFDSLTALGLGGSESWGDVDMNNWAFPVILDLDDDGFEIVPLSRSTARFDVLGDGRRRVVAWVGPDDALLVYDRDGDRLISHRDEVAFSDYLKGAKTDIEGLRWFDQLAQGGNADGLLDAHDALWSRFGVWRDADQDGETDAGELSMTGQGGLSAVNLTSDQHPRAAGPDARVFGRGTFDVMGADGDTQPGDLYDTALRYDAEPPVKFVPPEKQISAAARALYDHPTSQPKPKSGQRMRKDGQPLSRAELLYPKSSPAEDYVFVEVAAQ